MMHSAYHLDAQGEWTTSTTDSPETWSTAVEAIDTPHGTRYIGVTYVGLGRTSMDRLPRGARVIYRTPPRVHASRAYEQARDRTIHHNVWHDGSEAATNIAFMHRASYCKER